MGAIPITFLFLSFFFFLKAWSTHPAHTSTAVTLPALWLSVLLHVEAYFEAYSQFSRSWNANSFAPTLFKWLMLVLRPVIYWELRSIPEKVGSRCPRSCYANYCADNSSLIGRRGTGGGREGVERGKDGGREGENSEWRKVHCWWLLFVVCVTTVNRAGQTGSKISGHPKTRASVLILPAGNDSLARFRGNSEDSRADKVKGWRTLNDTVCSGSANPVCGCGLRAASSTTVGSFTV